MPWRCSGFPLLRPIPVQGALDDGNAYGKSDAIAERLYNIVNSLNSAFIDSAEYQKSQQQRPVSGSSLTQLFNSFTCFTAQ